MSSVDLIKNRAQLVNAWKEVLNTRTSTNWALFGYEGQSNVLKVNGTGDGGIIELSEDLNSGKIMYAFVGLEDPKTTLNKYLLINWQGEGVPALRKGTCANHIRDIQKLFTGAHLTLNARTEDEVDQDLIMAKLNAVGSAYSFKEPRTVHEAEQSGPVGTNYSRVNPSKEISSQDRDDFWRKEEEEERHRLDLERECRENELLKQEEERRAREEKEHLERERRIAAQEAEAKIPPSNGKSYIQHPTSPVKVPTPTSPQRSITQAEEMRQQRNKEAKELIGGRVGTAKAIFDQNSAAGQLSAGNNGGFKAAPVKPVRNSIAQRINSLNSQQQPQDEPPESNYNRNVVNAAIAHETPSIPIPPSNNVIQEQPLPEVDNVKTNNVDDLTNDAAAQKHLEEDDGDQFSTIKRSPYSKSSNSQAATPVETQPPAALVHEPNHGPSNHSGAINGNGTQDSKIREQTIEDMPAEDMIYQNVMSDEGLRARALYDYQADDESEITFDPGDVITHIDQIDEGWWQGLGPDGTYGLFPANYVELIH